MLLNSKTFKVICGNSKPVIYVRNVNKDFERIKHTVIIRVVNIGYRIQFRSRYRQYILSCASIAYCIGDTFFGQKSDIYPIIFY